jgi:putative transposase
MEFYHVLNRGVDKRTIVQDNSDRLRFLQGLYLYNDLHLVDRNVRRLSKQSTFVRPRKQLVHIHAFCLMDNHYHLLLSPVDDDPINLSAFMRKLNMGYSKYFNEKYDRSGALWQGKYKAILMERDEHFLYIPYYIHLNALDTKMPEWRDGKVKNITAALAFMNEYKWSSYLSYLGLKHYQSITSRTELNQILGSPARQLEEIKRIITQPEKAADSLLLE